ncbi:uncharacterized protein J8A68_003334 [[Candida] subhashii]|uniref:Ribosomal RNA-processing protein 14/surfeit locus protein 6 C-terminal domain-containing protein n=1 Tax=[Candida] subhashii TaxID=561895 RepID=A0A8J5QE99_9ASCO|nr:uncharacterized protein J8A68_003334 [[Candida] subhashii]KAG7663156.1 hypothetical protein J8A68_003334 [[Candida] subhashii]
MTNSLEERLKIHSTAFDGLLSLIPAKYYYDLATQDQWNAKKKSKSEISQHKRAKLNPENREMADEYENSHVSAKDVMDNSVKKGAKKVELPKKLPAPIYDDSEEDVEIPDMDVSGDEEEEEEQKGEDDDEGDIMTSNGLIFDDEGNEIEEEEQESKFEKQQVQKNKKKKQELSPEEKKQRDEKLAKLREQLASKITNLKEKRKAPGTKVSGAPQSREQILAERKRKEELRKEKRKHAELEDDDSDSDSEGEDVDEEVEQEENKSTVLFGNIVFQDGSQVTSDLTKLRNTAERKKQKGPANNDLKAHLNKIQKKKEKLATLSKEDQTKVQEKEKWKRVMLQAEGVKVKDDEKLLKKALKRKEKQKLKSEIEWKDRKQIVKDTVDARAKRREANLKARRDNKKKNGGGKKSKQQPKLRKFTGIVNKKKRAGFEGSAKSKGKK